jgi:hypothetical protein
MRKISKQIAHAFNQGKTKSIGNTMTNGKEVYLHGNKIAWRSSGNGLELTLAGWPTVTTRERLNAILYVEGFNARAGEGYGFYFNQKNHNQFLTKISFNGYEKQSKSKPIADNEIITLYQGSV